MRRDSEGRGRRWGRRLLALLLGAVATLALPPIGFIPAFIIAFSGLLLLSRDVRRVRQAFAIGWWFGFGHFATGLYWIANAFTIDGDRFVWFIPFAALGLPAVIAIYSALALAAVAFTRLEGVGRVIAFAVAWTGMEWLRGHLFTGFPWNLAAYTWVEVPEILQSASVIGAFGLTLLTVLAAALPAAWGHRYARRSIAVGVAALALGWGFGHWRLAGATEAVVDGVRLRLVQASVPQQLKWQLDQRIATLVKHLTLTRTPAVVAPTLIIWPETAVPFLVEAEPEVLTAMATAAPAGGAIITGTIRLRGAGDPSPITNGLVAIDGNGRVVGAYDKAHLVPFGEYTPLSPLLDWVPALPGASMVPGPGPASVRLPGAPAAGALICYEVIFPGKVIDRDDPPQWLLNLTNDAWYGRSAGPYQHFAIARMRAVEEGMPLVRAAQNGISGVVDPYGRVVKSLGLDEVGVIDADLPAALPPTPYARGREAIFAVLALIFVILAFRLDSPRRSPGN
ncbi:MAG: apolipoprotein N-acyltransferase [Alphaproteobacteria bacterium]|nr:apolipoprotein N-acyltransferase [Alphaproteobacteria bacterium]